MSHQLWQILMTGASRKRKEREALYTAEPSAPPSTAAATTTTPSEAGELVASNRHLAGYMACEFLTKGTLLGQRWEPDRGQALPASSDLDELKPGLSRSRSRSWSLEAEPSGRVKQQRYVEVAKLVERRWWSPRSRDFETHATGAVDSDVTFIAKCLRGRLWLGCFFWCSTWKASVSRLIDISLTGGGESVRPISAWRWCISLSLSLSLSLCVYCGFRT